MNRRQSSLEKYALLRYSNCFIICLGFILNLIPLFAGKELCFGLSDMVRTTDSQRALPTVALQSMFDRLTLDGSLQSSKLILRQTPLVCLWVPKRIICYRNGLGHQYFLHNGTPEFGALE